MSEGWARPVRIFLRSAWNVSTHLPMRLTASFLMSSNMNASSRWKRLASVARDDGADVVTAHDARQIAGIVEVEDLQRHAVVAAHHDGGGIHHVEPVLQ